MNKIQIRPRFNIEVEMSKNEITERIKKKIETSGGNCDGKILDHHIVLKIPEDRQKFWSPELSIEIIEEGNNSIIKCLLGPKSTVWTLFATFYGLSVFIGLIGLVLGLSQWSIGMKPYGLLLVILSFVLIILAYLIALSGQKLAYKEMFFLKKTLKSSLDL